MFFSSYFLGNLRTREKQLEELEAKTAQLLAVMPSDTMLSSSQLSQILPGLSSSSMEGMNGSPMSYTSSVMNNHHHHHHNHHQQQLQDYQKRQHQQQQDNSNLDPMAAAYTPNSKNPSLTAG